MKLKQLFFLMAVTIVSITACNNSNTSTQETDNRQTVVYQCLTVSFYNVENLFDTINDPNTEDDDFTPESKKQWNGQRYSAKLDALSKVLIGMDSINFPVLIGLAEVENGNTLVDLIDKTELKTKNYKIIHEDSPDNRGIDVALLYQADQFMYLEHKALPIDLSFVKETTRDILHVKGVIQNLDTVNVFVNHWSSRRGGDVETEPKRIAAATVLRKAIDELLTLNPDAKIIIMGDMNDEPVNKSLSEVLGASDGSNNAGLINLMFELDKANKGSYNYKGDWNMIDNLIVSRNMLEGNGLKVKNSTGYVYQAKWFMYYNKTDKILVPNKTYGGDNYYGGASDHLPVYFVICR